jgi:O-methyltransferase
MVAVAVTIINFQIARRNQMQLNISGISNVTKSILDKTEQSIIYYPTLFWSRDQFRDPLFQSSDHFLKFFKERLIWIDGITIVPNVSLDQRSRNLYIEMLISILSATVYSNAEFSVIPELRKKTVAVVPFNRTMRDTGMDWTYIGDTMVGRERLRNLWDLLNNVHAENIEGDFIETGVWRGGSSILARGILETLGSQRRTFVCDSFRGLPPGSRNFDIADSGWDETPYLEVSDEVVAHAFNRYSLLSEKVIFVKGFFNESMPLLRKQNVTFSILRLDVSKFISYFCNNLVTPLT